MNCKRLPIVLLLTFFLSCTKKEHLDPVFKSELLNYQKLFPLPEKSDSLYPFYIVRFHKKENDTLFHIVRAQVLTLEHYEHCKVFEDKNLKPTVIFDFDSLGKKIIYDYPERLGEELLKTGPIDGSKPYYLYELKNNEIIYLGEKN